MSMYKVNATRKGYVMTNTEHLKAVYEEKQAKYQALCDAVEAANEAQRSIKALCDVAMADMHEAGQQLLKAMQDEQ